MFYDPAMSAPFAPFLLDQAPGARPVRAGAPLGGPGAGPATRGMGAGR